MAGVIHMSWTYFLNRMGPLNPLYKGYAGGRVDASCSNSSDENYYKYGQEVAVPMMEEECWYEFAAWVDELRTSFFVGTDVFKLYEQSTGRKIKWYER